MQINWVAARQSDDGWVRCSCCGHKLFRLTDKRYQTKKTDTLEIKCHSCKIINRW